MAGRRPSGKMFHLVVITKSERWGDPVEWWIYERLGALYPLTILVLDLVVLYVVFAVAVALLPLWIDISSGKFVLILIAALALQTVQIGVAVPTLCRAARPLVDWLRGARTRHASEAAWAFLLADSVVNPLRSLRTATERVTAGDLGVRVPVVSSDETGELTRSFNQMVAGLEERERLHHAFGTFVDPGLTERVMRDGTVCAGEEVDLSILFVDVRDFTSFAERADAHQVVSRLNELYGQIVPVVLRHGGHANKFIGDGLLAIFGAPERYDDHADRAVTAALEIAELVSSRYQGALRVGVGVNSGRVVVGTVGGSGRLDFTAIGDSVNTAARVEAATRRTDDDLLITESTLELLRTTHCTWEARDPIQLKGKAHPVALFAPELETGARMRAPEVGRMRPT